MGKHIKEDVKPGSTNERDIYGVQAHLNNWILLGFPLHGKYQPVTLTGKCDAQTVAAIKAFQKHMLGKSYGWISHNGKTADILFGPLTYSVAPPAGTGPKHPGTPADPSSNSAVDWVLDDVEAWEIRKRWGQEIVDWIEIPPDGKETKEFKPPSSMRSDYKTVLVWKSLDAKKDCPLMRQPYKRVQIIALLRDDERYWDARTNGSSIQSNMLRTAAATAIRDYREYVIRRKYCPPAAYSRLVQVNKDVVYQMFLGMFQLLSPHPASGVPGGPYYKSAIDAVNVHGAIKQFLDVLNK